MCLSFNKFYLSFLKWDNNVDLKGVVGVNLLTCDMPAQLQLLFMNFS